MLLGSIERLKTGYYSALRDEQDEDIESKASRTSTSHETLYLRGFSALLLLYLPFLVLGIWLLGRPPKGIAGKVAMGLGSVG